MGLSAGPGSPIRFRCAGCRRRTRYDLTGGAREGFVVDVKLTGRSKPRPRRYGSARGVRSDKFSREYVCRRCGHKGWSSHIELAREVP